MDVYAVKQGTSNWSLASCTADQMLGADLMATEVGWSLRLFLLSVNHKAAPHLC